MAAGETTELETAASLRLLRDIASISAAGFSGVFKKDCADLARRVSLLSHLLEEIRDFKQNAGLASCSSRISCFSDLTLSLEAAKRLFSASNNIESSEISSDGATKKIFFQFQCVTWKLEKALANLPYADFELSEEVQEQIELVRAQLRRATERYGGPVSSSLLQRTLSQPLDKEIDAFKRRSRSFGSLCLENSQNVDLDAVPKGKNHVNGIAHQYAVLNKECSRNGSASDEANAMNDSDNEQIKSNKSLQESENVGPPEVPEDFLCPISLEPMRDPVIVATGQTYERSCIQRWIDSGNKTCPKTQEKLRHLTLTPNYVLRSLISQWCVKHNIEQPNALINGRIKKSDGSFRDVSGDIASIKALVLKLSSRSTEERRAAVAEIRSISKRSTDNRILLAEAGAIPVLVNLLTSEDGQIQDNAVTSILNISIYNGNKGLIMLANAIPSIVQVLRAGSMEAKENAAATIFSLSVADENKIIIGASGAVPALVDLLQSGTARGKKDAAAALFNLCAYSGNKGRAVRAGIITALLQMLTDSNSCMVDEALTILSILSSHQEAKAAIVKANAIPVLIDLLRTGLPRSKESASAILLSLCRRDNENLSCLSRLGAVIPLSELAKSGTERAKRKAGLLLEYLRKSSQ